MYRGRDQEFGYPAFATERSEAKGKYLERQGTNVPQSRKMLEGLPRGASLKFTVLTKN